ncbi:MAG: tetratricopeptide repeat protein [Bacteroidales bacterium]
MAKNTKEDSSQGLKNVEETLTRTEHYLEENYKTLLIILGAAVLLVGLFYLGRIYLNKRNKEAQEQMFHAQKWLGMDSLKLALNGDGNYLGFLDIANNYKMTKAGNLAKYSAGMCYLHLGQFQEAIDFLSAYKHNDNVISSLAVGGIGDAYVELGNLDKGVEKYIEAANLGKNSFNTPIFLMKAGQIYELQQKYSDALKVYERIRDEYPESTEGTTIEKYIARVQLHTR